MLRIILGCFIFFSIAFSSDKVEIIASSMDTKGSIIKAYNGVTVIYKDYFLTSDRAKYNKKTSLLELFGNVRAKYKSNYKILGKYAKLNLEKKEKVFKPIFMLEKSSKVWLSANEGCAKNKDYNIDSGVLSGCDPMDPLWQIDFTSSDYNSDDMWLSLYNARIYIYDIPVLYTPYFGFSLDTRRRTGLLPPVFGYSDKEGFYYEQPFYIAEQNWWDIELRPQIRTLRGSGGYATFRFVDSPVSKGRFTTGYFKEKDSYVNKENLAHDTHYGFKFEYENNDFLNQWFKTNLSGQSEIYIDIKNMNDVDYINLSTGDTTKTTTATQLLSRVNMFYNAKKDYVGAYFNYYKDLNKKSNDDTLQRLPTIHYHHYLETMLDNHILYNIDVKTHNYTRKIGKKVLQSDVNIPLTFQTSLFDEYVTFDYTAYLYGQYSDFSGDDEQSTFEYKNGYFARQYNIASISSELARAYKDFTHIVNIGASYIFGNNETKTGYYEDNEEFCKEHSDDTRCQFYNIVDIKEFLQVSFTQYFFDLKGTQRLYHRLNQNILYEKDGSKIGELENELNYKITKNISFYNDMFFNYNEQKFSKIYNKLSLNGYGITFSISHLYKDSFKEKTDTYTPYTSYITSSINYKQDNHYSYFASLDYDVEKSFKKSSNIGFLYKKRCWEFGLKYLENIRPILTDDGSSSISDRYIYLTIMLKPIMKNSSTSNISFRLPD